jgi:Do/DeqQ family serine protease
VVAGAGLPAAVGNTPLPSLAPMLAKVTPAVVSVHSQQRVRVSPFGGDPVFRRLFPELSQERINESLGSGVIVDAARGLVLTNHHVIDGADDVSVTLADGRTLKASFVGSDPDTDIALLRIPAERLTALPLADSDHLRVGDFVVAVGNPFGLGQTVTSGIVSAVGRSGLRGLGYQNFIQTDASINPGNSGGALVNLDGQLVGINTASFNPQGSMAGNIGLGFAIPSNLAGNVLRQLLANGRVQRGTLGIESQDITPAIARALRLDDPRGALVSRVYADSSAAAAGLQASDVLLAINGQRIDDSASLRNFEGLQAVGSTLKIDLVREGRPLTLAGTLKAQPGRLLGGMLDPRLAGAVFVDLPESARQGTLSGVLVADVEAGSRAANGGLRPGDVVLATSGGDFSDLTGFRAALGRHPQALLLRVLRGQAQGTLQMN